jgi:ferrous iron transport protein A
MTLSNRAPTGANDPHPSGIGSFVHHLAPNICATILGLRHPAGQSVDTSVTSRLAELGFLPGESVTVLRRGPGGREPIAVQVGETVFALRALEAACIEVVQGAMPLAA